VIEVRRLREEVKAEISLAWRTANYSKAAKLPALDKELAKVSAPMRAKRAKPSMAQQRANLAMLSEFLGKPLQKTRLRKREQKD